MGLTNERLDDHVGDALLALCMLADEWDPNRGIPVESWVMSHLAHRMNDIARERIPGLRFRRHLIESAHDPHAAIFAEIRHSQSVEDVTTVTIDTLVADDRERFIIECLKDGMYHREIATALNISKTRVRQLIDRVGERVTR